MVFLDMFSFLPLPVAEVEGSSDEHPIQLDGITVDESSGGYSRYFSQGEWSVPLLQIIAVINLL